MTLVGLHCALEYVLVVERIGTETCIQEKNHGNFQRNIVVLSIETKIRNIGIWNLEYWKGNIGSVMQQKYEFRRSQ